MKYIDIERNGGETSGRDAYNEFQWMPITSMVSCEFNYNELQWKIHNKIVNTTKFKYIAGTQELSKCNMSYVICNEYTITKLRPQFMACTSKV